MDQGSDLFMLLHHPDGATVHLQAPSAQLASERQTPSSQEELAVAQPQIIVLPDAEDTQPLEPSSPSQEEATAGKTQTRQVSLTMAARMSAAVCTCTDSSQAALRR